MIVIPYPATVRASPEHEQFRQLIRVNVSRWMPSIAVPINLGGMTSMMPTIVSKTLAMAYLFQCILKNQLNFFNTINIDEFTPFIIERIEHESGILDEEQKRHTAVSDTPREG